MPVLGTRPVWELGRGHEEPRLLLQVRFVRGALRRHFLLVGSLGLLTALLAVFAVFVLPKNYEATCRIAFHPTPALALRADADAEASPMEKSGEVLEKAEGRRKMLLDTGALPEFEKNRAPIERFADRFLGKAKRTDEEKLQALMEVLKDRMEVFTGTPDTVVIRVRWPDPAMAARLAAAAEANFLNERYGVEVGGVEKLAHILEEHEAAIAADAERTVADLEGKSASEVAQILAVDALNPWRSRAKVPKELNEIEESLLEKERALAAMERSRQDELAALRDQLSEAKTEYTDQHPVVIGLRQRVEGLSLDSDAAAKLRSEAHSLTRTLRDLGEREPTSDEEGRVLERPFLRELRHPNGLAANNRLAVEAMAVDDAKARIEALRIEAETAKAAFPLRYVVGPPEVSRGPVSPDPVPVILAALLDGVLVGCLLAVWSELRSGALWSRSQLEKILDGAAPVIEVRQR